MAFADDTIDKFLRAVADGHPTPGGGAVAAMASAAGAALCEMVCSISLEHTDDREIAADLEDRKSGLADHRSRLLELADEDSAAIRALYGEAHDDDPGSEEAVDRPTERAIEVPREVAERSLRILELATSLAEVGYGPAVGDVGTAAYLANAGCQASVQNVRLNLRSVEDSDYVATTRSEIAEMADEAAATLARVETLVGE